MTRILDPVKNGSQAIVTGTHTSLDTIIHLLPGERANLPSITDGANNLEWYLASKYDRPKDDPNWEIVRYTANSGTDDIVVTRAQEGTTATAKNLSSTGYRLVCGLSAKMINDIEKNLSKLKTTYVVGPAGSGVEYECDGTDDHVQMQQALDAISTAGFGKMIIISGSYSVNAVTGSLTPPDNCHIVIEKGATINVATNSSDTYAVFYLSGTANVTFDIYGKMIGDKDTHTSVTGQHGFGIDLRGTTNISINFFGGSLEKFWGDGIYVGTGTQLFCEDTYINNFSGSNNRRQGISIISAKNLFINNFYAEDTDGQSPSAGIDIEPNYPTNILENIHISNVSTKNNTGAAISVALQNLDATSSPVSININGINSQSDGKTIYCYGDGGGTGYVNITNVISKESEGSGLEVRNWGGIKLNIERPKIINCNVSDTSSGAYGSAISIHKELGDTGVGTLRDITIKNPSVIVSGVHKPEYVIFVRNYQDDTINNISIIDPIDMPTNTDTISGILYSNASTNTDCLFTDKYEQMILANNGSINYPDNLFSILDTTNYTSSRIVTLKAGLDNVGELVIRNLGTKNITITPQATDYIIPGCAIGESIVSSGTATITLKKINSTQWIVTEFSGIWKNESGISIDGFHSSVRIDNFEAKTAGGIMTFNQTSDEECVNITSSATTSSQFALRVTSLDGATAVRFLSDAGCITDICNDPTASITNHFFRNLDSTITAGPVVKMTQDHLSDDQNVLNIQQDGTGKGQFVDQNGDNYAIHIDSEATTKAGLQIDMANVAYVGFNTNGLIQGVNVTSGADPGHTHTAYETAGAVSTHASLQTGIHGISITTGKTFSSTGTLTLAGTDGSTLNIGTGGTLGTAAYTDATAYEASGSVATHAALTTGIHGLAITAGQTITVESSSIINQDLSSDSTTVAFGGLSVGADTDITSSLGRVKVGYNGTNADWAIFAHFDSATASSWAIMQTSTGTSYLNCATGQQTYLTVNGAEIGNIALDGLTMALNKKLSLTGNNTVSLYNITQNSASTDWTAYFATTEYVNTNTTNNNFSLLQFSDTVGGIGMAGIVGKYVDHTNNYGEIYFFTNNTDGFQLRGGFTKTGLVTDYQVIASADTDTVHTLGRVKIGYLGSGYEDQLGIAHYDFTGGTDFAMRGTVGATVLNARDELYFQLTGITNFTLNPTNGLYLYSGINLSLHGNAANSIDKLRHTIADTAGNNLTINSGGATSGATDKNGGNLILKSGIATGNGASQIDFYAVTGSQGAGTTDRSPALVTSILGGGVINSGADTDVTMSFGRAKIGYDGTNADQAAIAHIDQMSSTGYSWAQTAAGTTLINAPTGQTISNRINNANILTIHSSGITVNGTSATYDLTFGSGANRTIGMQRTTASIAGRTFTVNGGGTKSGNTDLNGGNLILNSGIATGNGGSATTLCGVPSGQGTGTTDRNPEELLRVGGTSATIKGISTNTGTNYWQFAGLTSAAAVLDATQYLNVTVDGVAYKIALIT